MKRLFCLLVPALLLASCAKKSVTVDRPPFSADSAYAYVEQQLAFGPRVPNSQGHLRCASWLIQQLQVFGADVTLQKGTMPDYSGREQQVLNVIGHFGGYDRPAILLCAHYDTRPWCDQEEDYNERMYNVPGANDGASGVAVLLEVARQIGTNTDSTRVLKAPVEIVFFDVEDMGTPTFYTGVQRDDTWCLGSQLWEQRYRRGDYSGVGYQYGILLDMVGAPDAVFPREYYSEQLAGNYVEQIWRAADRLGYGRYFSSTRSYPITDDHVYVNRVGIPCVDIIHYDARSESGFPSWWHTRNDDMSNISKVTLQAVGETVLSCLY